MKRFRIAKALEGEEIVFGPVRSTKDSSLPVHVEENHEEITHTSFRTVAVTNQRVVVEEGDSCITIPNVDITAIVIKHHNPKSGKASISLVAVESKSGLHVRLNMPNLPHDCEHDLMAIFPNASFKEQMGVLRLLKGLLKGPN